MLSYEHYGNTSFHNCEAWSDLLCSSKLVWWDRSRNLSQQRWRPWGSSARLWAQPTMPGWDRSWNRSNKLSQIIWNSCLQRHVSQKLKLKEVDIFYQLPKPHTYFHVSLIEGTARIFPTSFAVIGNRTRVSSVAHLLRNFNPIQDALPHALPRLWQSSYIAE